MKPKIIKHENGIDTERAVEAIHKKSEEKEKVKRVTLDLPFSVYVEIRKKIIEEEQTLKGYFLDLAKDDLRL